MARRGQLAPRAQRGYHGRSFAKESRGHAVDLGVRWYDGVYRGETHRRAPCRRGPAVAVAARAGALRAAQRGPEAGATPDRAGPRERSAAHASPLAAARRAVGVALPRGLLARPAQRGV